MLPACMLKVIWCGGSADRSSKFLWGSEKTRHVAQRGGWDQIGARRRIAGAKPLVRIMNRTSSALPIQGMLGTLVEQPGMTA